MIVLNQSCLVTNVENSNARNTPSYRKDNVALAGGKAIDTGFQVSLEFATDVHGFASSRDTSKSS